MHPRSHLKHDATGRPRRHGVYNAPHVVAPRVFDVVHATVNMCVHMQSISMKITRIKRMCPCTRLLQTQAICGGWIGHFVGHRGTVACPKGEGGGLVAISLAIVLGAMRGRGGHSPKGPEKSSFKGLNW